mmetsp:Transcript_43138/g.80969  ORF Transcript_43138/g.80969 Transcript_43138/m.80969 type:complete len:839 (-) Transcript_43138:85-2601(-)
MHAIPEKLSALRQSLEATMIRQNVEIRQEFEKKIRDNCKDAEDLALQRAEELLAPQMRAMGERLQGLIQAVQLRAEEAFPKISEVADHLASTRAEVQPLHQRADAAAARLDRVAVETATTSKDCTDLNQDFKDVVSDLRAKLAEENRKRETMEQNWKALLQEASLSASAATQAATDRADLQVRDLSDKAEAMEGRLSQRLDEQAERNIRELKLGDEDVTNRLRPEIQAVVQLLQRRVEETQEHSEDLTRNCTAQLRGELDATAKRVGAAADRGIEQKARELVARMNEGFENANRRTETVREGAQSALHDASSVLRKAIAETRSGLLAECQALRQLIQGVETRGTLATEEAERKAVDASTKRLQDMASDIRKELSEAKKLLTDNDEDNRKTLYSQLEQAVAKLERNIQETAADTSNKSANLLGQAVNQLQKELAETLQKANERTDHARTSAAEALHKEVLARQEALKAAEQAREALAANIRAEHTNLHNEAAAHAANLAAKVDHRVNEANTAISNLNANVDGVRKDHSDTTNHHRNALKGERQRTEEKDAELSTMIQQVRDNLEAHLQSEAADIRQALKDARQKIYEEANSLRAELREQPTKKELVELASSTTEQYNELNTALDGHRSRLEAAVAEYATRVREARSEASEARLRMQRETMALGGELTSLRAASTSLANGVLKSLQVLGLLREDADLTVSTKTGISADAGKDGADGSATKASKEHQRGIEVEDLLEWEKVGKSLATRVARQWYLKESAGIQTVLAMVDRKAESDEVNVLKALMRECSPGSFSTLSGPMGKSGLMDTGSTQAPPSLPASPQKAKPEGVSKIRQQQVMGMVS